MKTLLQDNWRWAVGVVFAAGLLWSTLNGRLANVELSAAETKAAVSKAVEVSFERDEKLREKDEQLRLEYAGLVTRYEASVARMTAKIEGLQEQVARLVNAQTTNSYPKGGQ